MGTRIKSNLLCLTSVAALATVIAGPATAQDGPEEEIIVTGQRVERTLQETASSVFVLSAEEIDSTAGASDGDDLLALVPNVALGAGDSAPAIRGQDSTGALGGVDAFLGGTRPRSTISIDGRALNFNEFLYGTGGIWDLDHIEVYRGPQTTTQGRNSIGGAIYFVTNDPTYEFEGAARAAVADYSTRQVSATLSGPIVSDQLAARVALDWREGDRTVRSTGLSGVGVDPNADNLFTGRVKFLFEPEALPNLSTMLTYNHVEAIAPQAEASDAPFSSRVSSSPFSGVFETTSDSIIFNADYDINDAWSWTNTLTLTQLDVERFTTATFGTGQFDIEERSFESVLRFQPTSRHITGLLGVYYLEAEQDEATDFSGFLGLGDFRDEQTSIGVFGEITIQPVEHLFLTAGGRFQSDEQTRTGSLGPFLVDYDESFDVFLPKFEIAFDASDNVRIGATAQRGYNPGGTTISFSSGDQDVFQEEYAWNYEGFLRVQAFDDRLRLGANIFHTRFEDAQRSTTSEVLPGLFDTVFDNAEEASASGLELEIAYSASDAFVVRAGLGLLDTEIEEFSVSSLAVEGNEFQRAPNVSGTIGVTWRPIDALSLDVQSRYTDAYYSDDLNSEELKTDSTVITDLQVAYEIGGVRFFAYARNVFDEDYVTYLYSTSLGAMAEPQRIGGGVEVRF